MGISYKNILITGAVNKQNELKKILASKEAKALSYPCIEIEYPPLDALITKNITLLYDDFFDWLIITSQNTLLAILHFAELLGLSKTLPKRLKVACVGEKSALLLQKKFSHKCYFLPTKFNSETLFKEFPLQSGEKILFPHSNLTNKEVLNSLDLNKILLREFSIYDNKICKSELNLTKYLQSNSLHGIIFTSPSCVINCLQKFTEEGGKKSTLMSIMAGCIGTSTAKKAKEIGFKKIITPSLHTLPNLIDLLGENI